MPVVINILLAIHVMVSLLIVLIVLMQRPKNEGLGAAFGGGMTDNLFGAQTTNVLQTITRWLGGIFFALTLLLSVLYVKKSANPSGVSKVLSQAPPVMASTPAASLPTATSEPVEVTDALPSTAAPAIDAKAPVEMKLDGAPAPAAPVTPAAPADTKTPPAPKADAAPKPAEAPKSEAPAPAPAPQN